MSRRWTTSSFEVRLRAKMPNEAYGALAPASMGEGGTAAAQTNGWARRPAVMDLGGYAGEVVYGLMAFEGRSTESLTM
jgi:hypothetical protein